jgi:hypothetical protein
MTAGAQQLTTLTGTEQVVVDNGGAVIAQASTKLIASLWGQTTAGMKYTLQTATSSQTVTLSGAYMLTLVSLTQTAAALTIQLPSSPVDEQIAEFSLAANVTALTLTSGTTSTIHTSIVTSSTTSIGAYAFIYNAANTAWYAYV